MASKASKKVPTGQPTHPCASMEEILDHLCRESGIEEDLAAATDAATAAMVLTLARYLVATDSNTLSNFEEWQYTHDGPWRHALECEDIEGLMEQVAGDEWLMDGYFGGRVAREPDDADLVAFETTVTVPDPHTPGHSIFDDEDKYGTHTRRNTSRLLVLASLPSGRPLAYTTIEGALPADTALDRLLSGFGQRPSRRVTIVEDMDVAAALYIVEDTLRAIRPEDGTAFQPFVTRPYRDGRIFVQFVATCLTCALTHRLATITASLSAPEHKDDQVLADLAHWLKGKSCARVLAWFDAVRHEGMPAALEAFRWGDDALARDRLLCDLLGVTGPA